MTRISRSPGEVTGLRQAILLLLIVLATACANGGAQDPKPAPVPYNLVGPVIDRASLTTVERRGYEIYLRDIAASRATDAARWEIDLEKSGALGWIVVPYERGYLVRFVDRDERTVADVSVDPTSALPAYVIKDASSKDLSGREKAMWRARQLAGGQPFMVCSDRYDTVVIPEDDDPDSRWLVYLLAATIDPTLIMLGGHHRFVVDAEGRTVIEHLALSRSCLSNQYTETTAMISMSHIVSPEPVESQVYLSLLHGIPIGVFRLDSGKRWTVEGGRVRLDER